MKKNILSLAALLIASATFVACSNDDNIIEEQPTKAQTYTMTINASKGDGATTRALSIDGSGAKNVLNATWATTENIYVKKGSSWATGSLQPDADGTTATLKGELSGITPGKGDELTLQFPKSGDISYDGQLGTLADIATNFDYATATVTVESVSATTTFTNQQAIVKFTLVDKADGTTPLGATELTVNDGTNDYTITPASATSEIYVAIPGISGQTVTLTATVGSDAYTYEKAGVTFDNGQYYEITVKMKKILRTDLSMLDCAGNARTTMSTANCYMVHTAGYYKLPLVYGNAIKSGATNEAAYTGVTGNSDATATFPRHDGSAITAPWIKDNGIIVVSAELLWQDAEGLITAVGISGDYLTLTVGKNASEQEGNALVAAKDGNDNIVWSWHIWVTKQTFADLTAINTGNHTYTVTPVNLGWVGDCVSKGTNTFYQWGRKDPFVGTGSITNPESTATIADNIKNPTTFYNVSNKPNDTSFYNLWDAQQTGTGIITTATKKTVYDPCPAGFCVPTGNLYYYMGNGGYRSDGNWDDTNKGKTWPSGGVNLYFPASGYRNYSSGSLGKVGSYGYCWSASASNSYRGRNLYFGSSLWYWDGNFRAYGFPVRAVAEE